MWICSKSDKVSIVSSHWYPLNRFYAFETEFRIGCFWILDCCLHILIPTALYSKNCTMFYSNLASCTMSMLTLLDYQIRSFHCLLRLLDFNWEYVRGTVKMLRRDIFSSNQYMYQFIFYVLIIVVWMHKTMCTYLKNKIIYCNDYCSTISYMK